MLMHIPKIGILKYKLYLPSGTVNVIVSSYDAVDRQNMSLRLELELTEKLNLEL